MHEILYALNLAQDALSSAIRERATNQNSEHTDELLVSAKCAVIRAIADLQKKSTKDAHYTADALMSIFGYSRK